MTGSSAEPQQCQHPIQSPGLREQRGHGDGNRGAHAAPRTRGYLGRSHFDARLRHAGAHLAQERAQKRLVLLVTDGAPADIDERDPQYLRHDTRKAVEDLAMQGVHTYCLTLDPDADRYVARIFGENAYSIVDNVERLPERLPNVFAALTS